MLNEFYKTCGRIPPLLVTLVKPFVMRVEDSIKKGLTMINWNSLNIAKYIKSVYDAMHELKILIKRVSNFSFFSTLKASQSIGPRPYSIVFPKKTT